MRHTEGFAMARTSMRNKLFMATCGLACGAVALGVAPSANAALLLSLNGGAIVVPDNGPGDSDPNPGEIVNTSVVAGFGIAITVAVSNSPGNPAQGNLQV